MSTPPFSVSLPAAAALGKVERLLGTWEGALGQPVPTPLLRRENRVRTVLDTVAIEGNPLSLAQATAVLDGKRVRGERREILLSSRSVRASLGHTRDGGRANER